MKTEREFAIALKKAMRYARKHKSPQVLARHIGLRPGVYFGMEIGAIPITAYQLYVFIKLMDMDADFVARLYE